MRRMNYSLFKTYHYLFFLLFLFSDRLNANVRRDSLIPPILPSHEIYGFQLFDKESWPHGLTSVSLPPPNYQLSSKDRISIQILGRSQAGFVFYIDEEGFISPDQMPKIFLSGLTFFQAKKILLAHFSRFYSFNSGQFLVSLIPAGKIKVYVLGNVKKEGLYELPAFSNIFQAIASAGGPTDIASIRNIKLIHRSVAKEIDAYSTSFNPQGKIPDILYDFDIIHLPVSKIMISLSGAIQRPLKYEVLEMECLEQIIEFGGGLLPSANIQYAQLFRYSDQVRKQIDIYLPPFLQGKSCFKFQHGDSIVFKEIKEWSSKIVKISGAILFPGIYGLDSSETINKLLNKAVLSEFAAKDHFILLRKNENLASGIQKISLKTMEGLIDFLLKEGDEIIIDFKDKFKEEFTIEVAGKVKFPFIKSFPPGNQLRISEAIFLAGGLSSGASNIAYIFRNNPDRPNNTVYLTIDIDSILNNQRSFLDLWLETGDKLFFPDKTYLDYPTSIGIFGSVKFPQEFRFHPSLKLQDLFRLSGGIVEGADLNRIEIFRHTDNQNIPALSKIITQVSDSFTFKSDHLAIPLMPGDKVVVRNKKDLKPLKTIHLFGNIPNKGIYISDKQPYFLSDVWKESGGFAGESILLYGKLIRRMNGRIEQKFNLPLALQFPGDIRYDPILLDKDSIYIEEINNMIFLEVPEFKTFGMDSSMQYLPFSYKGNYGVKWYLNQYGGNILQSNVEGIITVLNLTGEVKSTSTKQLSKRKLIVLPGDIIKVTTLVKPETQSKKQIDWGKITDRILGITTTLSLFLVYLNR